MAFRAGLAVVLVVATIGTGARAQALGTFRWQLQPFCNLVTLSVHQDGGVYTLDGSDDQCGAGQRATVVGTAFLNPDGSIGMGLTSMTAPGAAPVVVVARLDLATVSGTWSDSAGNSGAFVFTPGAGAGGAARPVPPNGIRQGSITSTQLAPGAIGAAQIALGAIGSAHIAAGAITSAQIAAGAVGSTQIAAGAVGTAQLAPGVVQLPLQGVCPVGRYLRGVTAAGAIICEPFFASALSTIVDDPVNIVGLDSSIAIGADGLPVISHSDSTANALRITKCGNPACTGGNVSTTVDNPADDVGASPSIAIGSDGLPVISHSDSSASALRVTHCGNADCTAGNVSNNIDGGLNVVGAQSSIAIGADGLPVISHLDLAFNALRVTHCGNAACTAGNVSTTVDDPADSVGILSSIAIGADGLPVISHLNVSTDALRVTHCGNAACTAGNVSNNVDDSDVIQVGNMSSIAIGADGLPVISHSVAQSDALRVTHCGNAACTAGNVSTTVDDPANDVGFDSSIAIGADSLPVISHFDSTAGALRVTKCGNAACTANNLSTVVDDPAAIAGFGTSIAIGADGLPVISHTGGGGLLRVTKCGTQSCR